MTNQEIINLLYTAIELAGDGGLNPFTETELAAMNTFLNNTGWHSANELPPVDKNGNSDELIAITSDDNLIRAYFHYESDEYNFWVESDDWNKKVRYGVNVKRWCCPPEED